MGASSISMLPGLYTQNSKTIDKLKGTPQESLKEGLKESLDVAIAEFQEFAQDGLVNIQNNLIQVTTPGRLFIRNIAMCFDERMRRGKQPGVQYSRTV